MFQCDSCRLGGYDGDQTTVPAGEVAVDIAVCGYGAGAYELPKVNAADQNYNAGFCPGVALEKGTMFPELVSEY